MTRPPRRAQPAAPRRPVGDGHARAGPDQADDATVIGPSQPAEAHPTPDGAPSRSHLDRDGDATVIRPPRPTMPLPPTGEGQRVGPPTAVADFARAWTVTLRACSFSSLAPTEVGALALQWAEVLAEGMRGELSVATAGNRVGQALVAARFTGPEALGVTIRLIGDLLPASGLCPEEEVGPRLAQLQGAVSAGYAQALLGLVLTEQEQIRRAALVARDQAETALRASEARFRAVFTDAAVGIGVGTVDGQILDVNPALTGMLGYELAEFRRRTVADFMHPDDAAAVWTDYSDLVEGKLESFRTEKRFFGADGRTIWTHLTVSLIRGDDGAPRYQMAIIEDVTDRHQLQEQLAHEASHDPLTGLPNRARFLARLSEALADSTKDARVGLCFLDLDSFKVINDSLGHAVGDQLLTEIAGRLADCVADAGLTARLGGDEFVVLVAPNATAEQLASLTAKLLDTVTAPIALEGHRLAVGASIGVVEAAAGRASPSTLIRAADIALQRAKTEGKGRVVFHDPDRNATQVTLYTLAATLPGALDRGEFALLYQPLVRLSDGGLHGVEALLRWQHPRFGTLTPEHFIRLAEETGAILPLGRWILTEACRQAASRSRLHPDLLLSVNIAVRQLQEPGLVEDVTRALADSGLPPPRLQLEVTESAVMTAEADGPFSALTELADLGVRIAIDDFGTGYSNLAYLRRLPVHGLKLAGAFLEGLRVPDRTEAADLHLVSTLIHLAHGLGLTVTAEGVETSYQAEHLRTLRCDTAQGWHFGRPDSLDRLPDGPPR